jgi:hypothetical protein
MLLIFNSTSFTFQFQDNFVLEDDVLNLTSPDRYELVWFLPEDNGEQVTY